MSGITTDSSLSESTFFSPFLYIVKGLYLGQVSSQVSGVVLLSVFGLNSLDRNTLDHTRGTFGFRLVLRAALQAGAWRKCAQPESVKETHGAGFDTLIYHLTHFTR
jgi:hypothetical protein